MRPWPPPRKVRKHFLTRYTVKNGISNLYILLKMQEMPFQRPKFQKISGGHALGPPYNRVVKCVQMLLSLQRIKGGRQAGGQADTWTDKLKYKKVGILY